MTHMTFRRTTTTTTITTTTTSSRSSKDDENENLNINSNLNLTIEEATQILSNYDSLQQKFIQQNKSTNSDDNNMNNITTMGTLSTSFIQTQLSTPYKQTLRLALLTLTNEAHKQRQISYNNNNKNNNSQYYYGRIMIGICAENVPEGLLGLKTWVQHLSLPKGLLHGLDVDGQQINIDTLGSVYLKYNTGGSMTFSEMRKTGRGFDALWKPGDVVLEEYDGDFRGIYYNVELEDGVFRQYGVLPTDLFVIEEEDW